MQTIKQSNKILEGKVYPVTDLRTAESIEQLCEFVDAGHPISTNFGLPVFLLRRESDILFNCDVFRFGAITPMAIKPSELLKNIKLAPLAYRNGRPLHLGDAITFDGWNTQYAIFIADEHPVARLLRVLGGSAWRFANETKETK